MMDTNAEPLENVRVRFAPSPTGFLHVGGARTAIFNWLFARHTGGALVLRVEDTDVERSTKESEASLVDDLRWLGLDWDEGPEVGGPYGPYRQAERLDRYRALAGSLLDRGAAYPCFCTDEELTLKREAATAAGRSPHYDGSCRSLSAGQVKEKRAAGLPEAVRFRVVEGAVVFEDLVRGRVALQSDMVGDFVIIRSNGLPTYNFAAAHDDHAMNISHVIRGEEHLSNTLRQILIYRAMDVQPPAFAHVPLILAEDRSKLSKRHGASSVEDLRAKGFLPGAVVNYLAMLGWSHPDEKEKLSVDQLIDAFSIDRISKSAAVYDPVKLTWLNGLYIRDLNLDDWVRVASPGLPAAIAARYDAAKQRELLGILQEKVERLDQVAQHTSIFLDEIAYHEDARETLAQPSSREVLTTLAAELGALAGDWEPEAVRAAFKRTGKATGMRGKDLFFPIRAAVTGRLHGPDLARVTAVKGRASVLGLIERALAE